MRPFVLGVVLAAALASHSTAQDAGGAAPRPTRPPADVAVERVQALATAPADPEAIPLARLAVEMAGASALEPLASRLDAAVAGGAPDRGPLVQVFAWALGECAARAGLGEPARDAAGQRARARVIGSLRRALWVEHWPARLSAASALGLLEAGEAELDLVALVVVASSAEDRSPGRGGALLLALAGAGGDVARAVLGDALREGGDVRRARAMIALHARLGASCWPEVVDALEESPSVDVRATAAAILLLLAEPASACRVAEAYGRESDPGIRLTLVQALHATSSPIAREALRAIAAGEPDRRVAEAAAILAQAPPVTGLELDARVDSARVREALDTLAHGTGFPRDLRDIEGGATSLDLPEIERALRRMPLREDGAWVDDHARLAQVRARILCATWPDGVPLGAPRVGRLR